MLKVEGGGVSVKPEHGLREDVAPASEAQCSWQVIAPRGVGKGKGKAKASLAVEGTIQVITGARLPYIRMVPRPGSTARSVALDANLIANVAVSQHRPSMMIQTVSKGARYVITFVDPEADAHRSRAVADISTARVKAADTSKLGLAGVPGASTLTSLSGRPIKAQPTSSSQHAKPRVVSGTGRVLPAATARAAAREQAAAPTDDVQLRRRLLQQDAALMQLYQQVVGTGVISDAEFWGQRQTLLLSEQAKQPDVGYPSAGTKELKRTDTTTKVTFEMSDELQAKIFREAPAVCAAYVELVTMSKTHTPEEFWTRYFRSSYFHRGQRKGAAASSKTMEGAKVEEMDRTFTKFEDDDAARLRRQAALLKEADPTVDLTATVADTLRARDGHRHGYGTTESAEVYECERVPEAAGKAKAQATTNGGILLARPRKAKKADTSSAIAQTNTYSDAVVRRIEPFAGVAAPTVRQLPRSVHRDADFPDLEGDAPPRHLPLVHKDHRRYFELGGTQKGSAQGSNGSARSAADAPAPDVETVRAFATETEAVLRSMSRVAALGAPDPVAAAQVLVDTTRLFSQNDGNNTNTTATQPESLADVAEMHRFNGEVLRHFWTALKNGSRKRATKLLAVLKQRRGRLHEEQGKLLDMERPEQRLQALVSLQRPLDMAIAKYEEIQAKQEARRQARLKAKRKSPASAPTAAPAAKRLRK